MVFDVGFIVEGIVYEEQDLRCRIQGAGFRVHDSGCRVQGAWFRLQGLGCIFQGVRRQDQTKSFGDCRRIKEMG